MSGRPPVGGKPASDGAGDTAPAPDKAPPGTEGDELTTLPHREVVMDRFRHAIAIAKRNHSLVALLFVDIHQLRTINDTLGRATGHAVLKQAAHCLVAAVREVDTIGRHGSDQFLVVLNDISAPGEAEHVATKVLAALAVPCQIGGHVLRLSASIGISLYPQDGATPERLVELAQAALSDTRGQGAGNVVRHAAEPAPDDANRSPMLPSLAHSMALYEEVVQKQARMNAELREANGALVRAAIDAQQLQAAAEQAQRKQKGYLALVAHELRNPLAPLSVAASLLRGADQAYQSEMQQIIERQVSHMSRLIGDLLDLSRGESGKLRVNARELDFISVIDEAVSATRPSMDARLQRFSITLPRRPVRLMGDPGRLVQVLSNLLDNASKYTPRGGEISLDLTRRQHDVVLTVVDSGIGVSPDALSTVFEPFSQEAHAAGFSGAGMGIGLTVVRELVVLHGGTVVAHSQGIGLGSRFVVTLPLAGTHGALADGQEPSASPLPR